MVDFRGIALTETRAKQEKFARVTDMDVNITFENAKLQGKEMIIDFRYTVIYNPGIGSLVFKGSTALTDSPSKLSEYLKQWQKSKMFPEEVTLPLMNLINLTSSVNGVFVCRAINLPPPLVPPKLNLAQPKTKTKR
ncbi:MAG: hypothetical protein PHU63_02310 [Candidatus ainarchaeum sp.]|nr:hypothetical protein [Candidatus ainarchaeum sp.]